jgi:quercetin dioxygenase-like cupin family protein
MMPLEEENKTASPLGEKIKNCRIEKGLSLDFLANETGFSTEYLEKVESGGVMPSVGTLLQISRALDIDSSILLKEPAPDVANRISAFAKRTENYAYKTLTSALEKKHLKAFQIIIEPLKEHSGVGYQHEGEEFVYVLAGKIEVMVGDNQNILDEGDSLHFNSGIKHRMRNLSDKMAVLIVVLYVP